MSSRSWRTTSHVSDTSGSSSEDEPPTLEEESRAPSPAASPKKTEDQIEQRDGAASGSPSASASASTSGVRGSNAGDGRAEPAAQACAAAILNPRPGRGMTEPIYKPQTCRLCSRDTVYLTRSGLSGHATMHHGCWYSARRDEYMQIPEAELEDKRQRVKDGQQHRKFRVDPADKRQKSASGSTGEMARGRPSR